MAFCLKMAKIIVMTLMTPEIRGQLKEAYLKFLDLIKKYRIKEFGKLGLTHIPKTEIKAMPGLKLTASIDQLLTDQIIGFFKKGSKKVKHDEKKKGGIDMLIVNCIKPAEEIENYKNSLIIENGWLGVRVEPKDFYYILTKRNEMAKSIKLSKKEGDLVVLLINEENQKKSRKELARLGNFRNVAQISCLKNEIRRKLEKLGFPREETEKMIPLYLR